MYVTMYLFPAFQQAQILPVWIDFLYVTMYWFPAFQEAQILLVWMDFLSVCNVCVFMVYLYVHI